MQTGLRGRDMITTQEWSRSELDTVIDVALDLVDGVGVGDYIIVHAGFAIQRLSADEALETLAILERMERT